MVTSSSPKSINCLKKINFPVMQSMFILDTKSFKKGIELVKAGKPDLIDIRPVSYTHLDVYKRQAELFRLFPMIWKSLLRLDLRVFLHNPEPLSKSLERTLDTATPPS